MFGLTLANPALWAGIFAIGVPLLVHLMTRHTPVRVVFPTIRFLQAAKADQSRIYRVRHWLMLALRTLAIALILFAFLRPEYRARALVASPNDDAAHAAVILIDTSLSMGYADGGFSPFARAKVVAERVLDDLADADAAGVIFMGARPEPAFEELRQGTSVLVQTIQERDPELGRADVDAAIALALRQLEAYPDAVHEIHLVSDFQRTNWAAVDFGAIPEAVRVVFETVGAESASNIAITEAVVEPPFPVLGEPARVAVTLANYSDEPRDVPVRVSVGGVELPEQRVALVPRASLSVPFELSAADTGLLEGEVFIPEDGLAADDIRRFTVSLSARTPVIILTDNASQGQDAAHRFLRAALDPLDGKRTMFEPRTIAPEAFDTATAGIAQVAIVVQVLPFQEAVAKALVDFAANGGGLIYFLSEPADAANLALLENVSGEQFKTPFTLGALHSGDGNDGEPPAVLQQANYDHPLLRKFRDTGSLAALQFTRYFETQRREAEGQILLQYDNRSAALAYRGLGLGGVLLANFTVDAQSSALPKNPVFLPLIHEMVKTMRPHAAGARDFVVGAPAAATVRLPAPDSPLQFSDPAGQEVSAGLNVNGSEATIIFSEPREPGFWRIRSGLQKLGSVAVNTDARESDLVTLNVDQLRELAAFSRERFIAQQGLDAAGLRALRHGRPFWHYLLVAAAAALFIEQAFAWRWKR